MVGSHGVQRPRCRVGRQGAGRGTGRQAGADREQAGRQTAGAQAAAEGGRAGHGWMGEEQVGA